jgi:D-glycero-alpha-D-manno-heptose-7-phosphate kinase
MIIEENLEGINQKFEVLKTQAKTARELVTNLNIKGLGELLADSWEVKKSTSRLISNELIDSYYELAMAQGAYGGKLCGAGGGGYLLFVAPPEKVRVIAGQIKGAGVITHPVELDKSGVEVWMA